MSYLHELHNVFSKDPKHGRRSGNGVENQTAVLPMHNRIKLPGVWLTACSSRHAASGAANPYDTAGTAHPCPSALARAASTALRFAPRQRNALPPINSPSALVVSLSCISEFHSRRKISPGFDPAASAFAPNSWVSFRSSHPISSHFQAIAPWGCRPHQVDLSTRYPFSIL